MLPQPDEIVICASYVPTGRPVCCFVPPPSPAVELCLFPPLESVIVIMADSV